MLSYYIILFILGTFFGSFGTVLISRWKEKKSGIMMGRSECPHCNNQLSAIELIPIFSWIVQGGRCRNCKNSISYIYPFSEIFIGLLFVWSGYISLSFGYSWEDLMWWIFLFWSFVTGIYILYDLRYMEIPDQIIIPGILITVIALFLPYITQSSGVFFYDYLSYDTFHTFITDHIFAGIFLYSFFFLQILIPGTMFFVKKGDYAGIMKLFFSYFTFPVLIILEFFGAKNINREDESIEIPSWIGGGDLRLALFIGFTLGGIHTVFATIGAYIVGSIVGLSILLYSRLKRVPYNSQLPFGPFLGIGWILSLTFYTQILLYIEKYYM